MGKNLLKQFEQHLINEVGVSIEQYIDEVNSFPAATILNNSLEREHYGGETHIIQTLLLRGYSCTTVELALDETEALARQLEKATQNFVRANIVSSLLESDVITTQQGFELTTQQLLSIAVQNGLLVIHDARVLSITTDEGLLAPYGMCDLEVEWFYVKYS